MTILSALSGSGRCSTLASSHGARIHTSRSVVGIDPGKKVLFHARDRRRYVRALSTAIKIRKVNWILDADMVIARPAHVAPEIIADRLAMFFGPGQLDDPRGKQINI
jgi:hypothetical protein